jgi:hypothetical protein
MKKINEKGDKCMLFVTIQNSSFLGKIGKKFEKQTMLP